jgi:hypothetical protein
MVSRLSHGEKRATVPGFYPNIPYAVEQGKYEGVVCGS